MQLSHWRNSGQFITVNDQQIFYTTQGEGPVLLLIHGYPTASFDWVKLWPALTKKFQCVTLDMLGFGFSTKAPTKYKIKEHTLVFLVVPELVVSALKKKILITDMTNKKLSLVLKEGVFFNEIDNNSIRANRVDKETNELGDSMPLYKFPVGAYV